MFRCPNCRHEKYVPSTFVGKLASCPKCKSESIVTASETIRDEVSLENQFIENSLVKWSLKFLGIIAILNIVSGFLIYAVAAIALSSGATLPQSFGIFIVGVQVQAVAAFILVFKHVSAGLISWLGEAGHPR